MDDQIAVRVGHRAAHDLEHAQPIGERQLVPVAVAVDGLALDELHHDVGGAVAGRAAVQEPGDVRMLEAGEDLALPSEVADRVVAGATDGNDLDGDPLAVLIVGTRGQIDDAHPAVTELAEHAVGADSPVDLQFNRWLGLTLRPCVRAVAAAHEGPYVTPDAPPPRRRAHRPWPREFWSGPAIAGFFGVSLEDIGPLRELPGPGAWYSQRTLSVTRSTFASPAVLKVALNQRVQPFVAACLTADSPLMYAKAASLISATIGAYAWLVFHAQTPVTVLLAAAALALALVGIGFNVQHDGNHGTFSRRPWLNRLAGFTLDLIGASSYFWKDKHNDNHHIYTNIPNEDADIQLGPLARLSADHPWYWWHRYQHFYLWALYTCVHLRYLYSDVQRLAFGKNDGLTAGYPKGADMAWLLGGKAFFLTMAFAVPLGRHDPGAVITVYLLISMTMGLIFSVVFQLAHTVDVVEHPTIQHGKRSEWAVHQVETTANFATGSRLATFLLGGLNHQREHHLFPRVAHVHYPALSHMVREVCAERGIRCRENRTVLCALRSHYRFVRQMGVKPA